MERVVFSNQIKLSEDQGKNVVTGYAALYDVLSDDLGGYKARIERGAFSEALQSPSLDVRCLFNHSRDHVLGRSTNGTLILSEDENGLKYTVILPETTLGKDIAVLMQRGDISQSSIGFNYLPKDVKWETIDGERVQSFSVCEEIFDVSVVTVPAFSDTSAVIQKFEKEERTKRELKLRMMANRVRLALSV